MVARTYTMMQRRKHDIVFKILSNTLLKLDVCGTDLQNLDIRIDRLRTPASDES